MKIYDVLIIGMGASGMQLALSLAKSGLKIAILSKGQVEDSATYWAQGGIAVPFAEDDSPEQHIKDTLVAGAGLCNPSTVRFIVSNSLAAYEELIDMGFPVSMKKGRPDLGKEGGHSMRRIIHASDFTGRFLSQTLREGIHRSPHIKIFPHCLAVDLIIRRNRCVGAYVLNVKTNKVDTFAAKATTLATGGASWVYLYSSNPQSATGDGIAMAARSGCHIANMEFSQFHPTCLYHPQVKSFLLSEALRGEGAKLLLPIKVKGQRRFMSQFDKSLELAPRDVVARAIDFMMKRYGLDYVHLDISHRSPAFIKKRFPNTYEECLKFGIDMTKEPLPVIPAAHYTCGGILTGNEGLTDLENLYALGETACNGLHGANRLASNSLLECLVMARVTAQHIKESIGDIATPPKLPNWDESQVVGSDEEVVINQNWDELRRFMWNYVGIVRTNKRLLRALRRVLLLREEVKEFYTNYRINRDLLELRNLITCAELIIRSAIKRKESRGLHYNLDYPFLKRQARNTVIKYS